MLVGSVNHLAPSAWSRPRAAASDQSEVPGDRVELSNCPKSPTNPWPELKELGLVASTQIVPGPLGPALTETARSGLRAVLKRLQKSGATFHTVKWDTPDSVDKALKFLEVHPAGKIDGH